jgi:metal-responsive CopG/Arc/MetJ family transcriptional regulator
MPTEERAVRQSITLPARLARRVRTLAKSRKTSASRVLADLVEAGLEAREAEKREFLDLADLLSRSKDPAEQARIKKELARLTFGK